MARRVRRRSWNGIPAGSKLRHWVKEVSTSDTADFTVRADLWVDGDDEERWGRGSLIDSKVDYILRANTDYDVLTKVQFMGTDEAKAEIHAEIVLPGGKKHAKELNWSIHGKAAERRLAILSIAVKST